MNINYLVWPRAGPRRFRVYSKYLFSCRVTDIIYSEQCQTSPTCLGQGVPRQPQRRSAAQPGGGGGGDRARGRDCRRY